MENNKLTVGSWIIWSNYLAKVIEINENVDWGCVKARILGFESDTWFYKYQLVKLSIITEEEAIMLILKNNGPYIK